LFPIYVVQQERDYMPATLTIADETLLGESEQTFTLDFLTERVTVREIIRSRVYEEVQLYNASTPEFFHGFVQPNDTEKTLNGYKVRERRRIDWEVQYLKALQAFATNGFFILVDDRQVEHLDEVVEIQYNTRVSFVKLVPLVGG
jgi:hypothetical protein